MGVCWAAAGWFGKKTPVREASWGARHGRSSGGFGLGGSPGGCGGRGGGAFSSGRGTPSCGVALQRPGKALFVEHLVPADVDAGLKTGACLTRAGILESGAGEGPR